MTNRHWLKREVPAWVKEKLISEEEGKVLLARYRKGKPGPYKEAFFVMALVCLLGGLGFLGAGLWNGLTQDERFLLALVPLLVSLLFVATMVLLDRRIPGDPVAVKGAAMPLARRGCSMRCQTRQGVWKGRSASEKRLSSGERSWKRSIWSRRRRGITVCLSSCASRLLLSTV